MSQVLDIQVSRLAVGMIIDIYGSKKVSLGLFSLSGISKSKILAVNFNFFFNLHESIRFRSLINGLEVVEVREQCTISFE